MSKRSASRTSTKGPGSVKSGTKSTSGKKSDKPEACTLCTKPNKSLRILECNHGFCPTCLKQIIKEPEDKSGGKASKASQRGGRKSAAGAVKEEYECPKCNPVKEEEPPQPPEPEVDYGECAPCKLYFIFNITVYKHMCKFMQSSNSNYDLRRYVAYSAPVVSLIYQRFCHLIGNLC